MAGRGDDKTRPGERGSSSSIRYVVGARSEVFKNPSTLDHGRSLQDLVVSYLVKILLRSHHQRATMSRRGRPWGHKVYFCSLH